MLESVRKGQTNEGEKQRQEYYLEKQTAKLHEFNVANADILLRYAEVLAGSRETATIYQGIFPWLKGVDAWAERYTEKSVPSA